MTPTDRKAFMTGLGQVLGAAVGYVLARVIFSSTLRYWSGYLRLRRRGRLTTRLKGNIVIPAAFWDPKTRQWLEWIPWDEV